MGDYEGEYVKAPPDPTIYLVEDGKRVALRSPADWFDCGLRPLNKISAEELEAIPYSHDWGKEPQEEPPQVVIEEVEDE